MFSAADRTLVPSQGAPATVALSIHGAGTDRSSFELLQPSRGVGGNIAAGLDALGNRGALDEYRDDLAAIRREALAQMGREAEELGANAVNGLRFDSAEVGLEMVEVVAYGTAVVLQNL